MSDNGRKSTEETKKEVSRFTLNEIPPKKLAIAIGIAAAIIMGIIATNAQIAYYQTHLIEDSKQVATDAFHKLSERKEARLKTIGSGISGLYRVSNSVTSDDFAVFTAEITQHTSDIHRVLITENEKIIQAYPDTTLAGKSTRDVLQTGYVNSEHDQDYLLVEFPFSPKVQDPDDDRRIIISIPPQFFVEPDTILGEDFKASLSISSGAERADSQNVSGQSAQTIYQQSVLNGQKREYHDQSMTFSDSESANSIEIVLESGIQAYSTNNNLILTYKVWDSSFEGQAVPFQYLSAIIGSVVAIATAFLLLRSENLTRKLNETVKNLETSNFLKTEFINIASHELRTPIQPILAYAELAKKGKIATDISLDVIHSSALRLQQLSNDILDVSRIKSGTLTYDFERVDLYDVLSQVVDNANMYASSLNAGNKKIAISLEEDSRIQAISADKMKLSRALTNLVVNSVKFTAIGGIKIKTMLELVDQRADRWQIRIDIVDTGCGIPKEVLPRLFTRFATKDVQGMNKQGTGLGLFISKSIVEAHGGSIGAQNNEDGIGATFEVILPLEDGSEFGLVKALKLANAHA